MKVKILADITDQWVRVRMLLKVGFRYIAVSILTTFTSTFPEVFKSVDIYKLL
jgi:hypothetical protein